MMTLKERLELIYHYSLQLESKAQRLTQLPLTDPTERQMTYDEIQSLCQRIREISQKGMD